MIQIRKQEDYALIKLYKIKTVTHYKHQHKQQQNFSQLKSTDYNKSFI
jgi:hypothetical protein